MRVLGWLRQTTIYRDEIDVTQIGDRMGRYELGDLHARWHGIPLPGWLAIFIATGKFMRVKKSSYLLPYKHLPVINGAYTTLEALIAEGYAMGRASMGEPRLSLGDTVKEMAR